MQKLIVASGNKKKLVEIKTLLGGLYDVVSMAEAGVYDDIEETGTTFEENALIKARAIFEKTGTATVSDDSGLCVDALFGAPGVYSARYCGRHGDDGANNRLLLENLKDKKDRSAKFVAVWAIILPDGKTLTARGETCGRILDKEEGNGGFGYDPLFFSDDLQKSFGVATPEEKNSVSHRARALKNLLAQLEK